jgi:hypothetical protein
MVIRLRSGGTKKGVSLVAGAALALGLASLVACTKDKDSSAQPGGAQERKDKAAQLTAPAALFAHIPAGTPYVFASFEPIPRSYWAKMAPPLRRLFDMVPVPDRASSPGERFAVALMRELKANMNEAGLRKTFGIGAEGRFALYGIGLVPVLRVELADGKALLATIERLQAESGLALPTASVGGRSYWRFASDDVLIVAAVTDNQVVFSGGPLAQVDKALPFIMGVEQPKPNMADGGQLKKVAAQHGFAGYGVGYVDSTNLLKLLFVANLIESAGGSNAMPPACMEQVTALARRFPRLAMGYDEFSDKKIAMRLVFETDAALAGRLKQLTVSVPGLLAGAQPDRPLFAFGAAIDIDKARQLAVDATDGVNRVAAACGTEDLSQGAAEARAAASQPLPPGLDKIRGGLVSVLDGSLGPDGKPTGVSAYAVLATDDPNGLLELVKAQLGSSMPAVPADGKFHDVVPAGQVPGLGAVSAAVKSKAIVAAVGTGGSAAAERALTRTGPSPLLYVSYDYGKLMTKVMAAAPPGGEVEKDVVSAMSQLFGAFSMWALAGDQGVTLAMEMELR